MPRPGALERRNGPHLELRHPQRGRRRTGVGLLRVIATALPGNEGTADREQRSRVLDEDRERGQRSRDHEVVRADPFRPSLGPGPDRVGVRELQALDRPPHEGDLPTNALHESHARVGKRDRQHEPRKPTTRPKIGDPPRTPHLGQLEGDERIRHVHINTLGRIPHRRDRTRLLRYELEQRRQALRRLPWQRVAAGQFGEAGADVLRHGQAGMQAASPSRGALRRDPSCSRVHATRPASPAAARPASLAAARRRAGGLPRCALVGNGQ
jgi:hypothetical protein